MLILACFALAGAIMTAIELDRELGGRWRVDVIMLSSIWVLMFAVAIDDEDALLGFTGLHADRRHGRAGGAVHRRAGQQGAQAVAQVA